MNSKKPKPKAHVKLTAYWGNDDAESTIKVSRSRWKAITEGGAYETTAWGGYEGGRFSVSWQFQNGSFSVLAADGNDCIIDAPIEELIVQTD